MGKNLKGGAKYPPGQVRVKLTIIGPTRTLKYKASTINDKIFGPTKVGVVGPIPPALKQESIWKHETKLVTGNDKQAARGTISWIQFFGVCWKCQGRIGTYNFVVPGLSEPLF